MQCNVLKFNALTLGQLCFIGINVYQMKHTAIKLHHQNNQKNLSSAALFWTDGIPQIHYIFLRIWVPVFECFDLVLSLKIAAFTNKDI